MLESRHLEVRLLKTPSAIAEFSDEHANDVKRGKKKISTVLVTNTIRLLHALCICVGFTHIAQVRV